MLHLYALFEEYIHILCIYTVYIRPCVHPVCMGGGGRSSEPRISAEAIDSQKAARWCVEQGLMQADGASFKPSRHTFRLQVIKAWNDLQAMQKAG